MKKIFDISSDEIKRILTLHEERTRKQYLPEFIFEDTILNEGNPVPENNNYVAKCNTNFKKSTKNEFRNIKTISDDSAKRIARNLIDACDAQNVKYVRKMLGYIKTCGDLFVVEKYIRSESGKTLYGNVSSVNTLYNDKELWVKVFKRPMEDIITNTSKQIELKKKKEEEEKKKKAQQPQQSSTDPFSNTLLKTKQEHKIFKENSGNAFLTIPVGTDFQKTMYNNGTAAQFAITHNNTDYMGYFSCKDGKYYITPYNDTSSAPFVFVPSSDHKLDNSLKKSLNCWGEFNAKKFGINCAGAKANRSLAINQDATTPPPVTITIPYTSGDGTSVITSNDINSTGVEGLTAKLNNNSAVFESTGGTITFNISGTPTTGGTATFTNLFGCTVNIPVGKTAKTVATPGGGTGTGGKAKGVNPKVNQTVSNTQKIQQTYLKTKPTGTITSQDINNLITKIG